MEGTGKPIDFADDCCIIAPDEIKEMDRQTAENILDAIEMLRKIDTELGVSDTLGIQLDHQELQNAFNDAQITILESELDARETEVAELTMKVADGVEEREHLREDITRLLAINAKQAERIKEASELLTRALPYVEFVEGLIEEDEEELEPALEEGRAAFWAGTQVERALPSVADPESTQEYIADDNANLRALQAENYRIDIPTVPVEGQDFKVFDPNRAYVPGDCVVISDMQDSSFNGTYKMDNDRVFKKVEDAS